MNTWVFFVCECVYMCINKNICRHFCSALLKERLYYSSVLGKVLIRVVQLSLKVWWTWPMKKYSSGISSSGVVVCVCVCVFITVSVPSWVTDLFRVFSLHTSVLEGDVGFGVCSSRRLVHARRLLYCWCCRACFLSVSEGLALLSNVWKKIFSVIGVSLFPVFCYRRSGWISLFYLLRIRR